jgi:hypothetical protein
VCVCVVSILSLLLSSRASSTHPPTHPPFLRPLNFSRHNIMSLFGESPPSTRSLFASPDFSGGSPSLFEDDDNSAWAGATSPRSIHRSFTGNNSSNSRPQSLGDVVRTLLTADNANIPRAYYDIYEKLVSEFGDGADGKVEAHGATDRVLDEAEILDTEDRNRIWELIAGRKDLVGRGEVWCLLAMVGLVQEGDRDIGVDAVDVRRRSEFRAHPSFQCGVNTDTASQTYQCPG